MSSLNLQALVIDPDSARVIRLKQAARAEGTIHPFSVRTSDEARSLLSKQESSYQLIFFSPEFTREKVAQLIREFRTTPRGSVCAYIILIDSSESDSHAISRRLLDGIDGFLQEPFSVDGLHKLVHVARSIINKDSSHRAKNAVEVAVVDVLTYVDAAVAQGQDTLKEKISPQGVESLQRTLREVYEMDEDLYCNTIVESFEKLLATRYKEGEKAEEGPAASGYRGASNRVRKKMKRQELLSRLEEEKT